MSGPVVTAITLHQASRRLEVGLDTGEVFFLPCEYLRVNSPSAEVQGHSPDQRVTVSGKRNVKISKLEPTGNYATKIFFDDGHSTGLFAWTYLDTLGREKGERWAAYEAELAAKGMSRG